MSATSTKPCDTPVAFFIYRRPQETALVFERIARARPRKLLVVADGPKTSDEVQACEAARAVIRRIDWDCDLETNFANENLGCRARVASGLDWVFDQVDEAIIVEDDCLPDDSFFGFCAQLLVRYRHDERVAMISGSNFAPDAFPTQYSYAFSRANLVWGWASWRRAWRAYDIGMLRWSALRDTDWLSAFSTRSEFAAYWADVFERTYAGEVDTWDYQWVFAIWAEGALSVVPRVNLVRNIGFGAGSTHKMDDLRALREIPVESLSDLLDHPPHFALHQSFDDEIFRRHVPWAFARSTLAGKARAAVRRGLRTLGLYPEQGVQRAVARVFGRES